MNRILLFLLGLFACTLPFSPSPLQAASNATPLTLGVFPYISANQMVEQLTPLIIRMEEALGQKVIMVSAPDFMTYMERTTKGEYDLVLTAPHLGRLAQKRDRWQRLVQSGQKTATVILVRKDSGITSLEGLRGKKMAVGNSRSVTFLLAKDALAEKGLTLGKDIELIETATFSNVVQSVFLKTADAGATPTLLWDKWEHVNAEQHQQLREIFRAKPAAPSFLVMANPLVSKETVQRLTDSLLHFHETPEGRDFFQKSQFESFLPLDEQTLEAIDPYVPVLLEERP